MKFGKSIWLFGASATVAACVVGVGACSSDSATGNPSGATEDASVGSDTGSSSGGDSGSSNTDSGGDTTDAGCGSSPKLHADTAGSIFCGYSDAGAFSCATGQECCLGGEITKDVFAPEACAPFGTECTNPVDGGLQIECGQVSDCAANGVANAACCLQGATAPTIVTGCSYYKASRGNGVVCEPGPDAGGAVPSCAAGEVQVCSAQADCPTGKTCTPMKWKLYQMGFCL
jgi:hypothetical protein